MPRLRVARVTGTTAPRLRVLRITAAGTIPSHPRARIVQVTAAGPVQVTVTPPPNLTGIEPGTVHTVTAALTSGLAADSWAWRVVSGPATTIYGSGPTVDITTPSHIDGATVTIGVRATKDGITSPETTFTLAALPWTEWWWTGSGWTPKTENWT